MSTITDVASNPTVHQLRSLWKPIKERLQAIRQDHPTTVRFHRCCSWLQSVEAMGDEVDLDIALISQWIAFNALYGQWDACDHQPVADRECWRVFVDRIVDLDRLQRLSQTLQQHKALVMSLLDDEYLSSIYWQDPCKEQAGKARRKKYQAQTWFLEGNWKLILEQMLERVYLMRCQLVHGAATYGGKLNRNSLRRCSIMLGHLLPTMLHVMIDHGADEDWGVMCYPPLRGVIGNGVAVKPK